MSDSVLRLAELSFQLHKEFADVHDGRHKWGYDESTAYSVMMDVTESEKDSSAKKKGARGVD